MLLLEDKLTNFLRDLRLPDYIAIDDYDMDYCNAVDYIYDVLNQKGHKGTFSVFNGCSQVAIVIDGCSKVIKIPIFGTAPIDNDGDLDVECLDYFSYADDLGEQENNWNYCLNSYIKYVRAEEEECADILAGMEYYGEVDFVPVYIQDRVICYEMMDREESNKSCKINKIVEIDSEKDSDILEMANKGWVLKVLDYYGAEKGRKILDYVHENLGTDLHMGNIGFTMNGAPIILDWAGFRD